MKKVVFIATYMALVAMAVLHSTPAHAVDVFGPCTGGTDPGSTVCSATSDNLFGVGGIWNRILETFTFIIGAVSVLMVIVGGVRYVTSNGDQAQVTGAKNTILYSIIGLVVATMAYAIVHFVISHI